MGSVPEFSDVAGGLLARQAGFRQPALQKRDESGCETAIFCDLVTKAIPKPATEAHATRRHAAHKLY
jgi:hypothetical protein